MNTFLLASFFSFNFDHIDARSQTLKSLLSQTAVNANKSLYVYDNWRNKYWVRPTFRIHHSTSSTLGWCLASCRGKLRQEKPCLVHVLIYDVQVDCSSKHKCCKTLTSSKAHCRICGPLLVNIRQQHAIWAGQSGFGYLFGIIAREREKKDKGFGPINTSPYTFN